MDAHKVVAQPIETERLSLRQYQEGDEVSLFNDYCSDAKASKYLQRLAHTDVQQTQSMFENWARHKWKNGADEFSWIISEKSTNLAMGQLMLIQKTDEAEIHFGLGTKFQGQGFMQEAIKAVIAYIQANSSLKRIGTFCDVEHVKSQNVLLNSGFKRKEILKNWAVFPALGTQARDCLSFEFNIN